MTPITKEEYARTYRADTTDEESFARLARTAAELTDLLCFGHAENDEASAKSAMAEMICYWTEHGGTDALQGKNLPLRETVGNYSVTNSPTGTPTVNGLPVAPTALNLLTQAGLRNPAV